ncbi:putative membrane protein [Microbacterium ginsengiterrae]|uniref:Putative membrane protein n=1 Tax=Microbacterium ginsengiterrae TaxID=546115 RepID=A0A7W9F9X6_9MICO|nr:putative membrane protein [Microbacterium ginsengiterrae]
MLLTRSAQAPAARRAARGTRGRFSGWRRERPFIGGLLVAVSGVEMFFSGQMDLGHLHVQLGIEGLQATIIPIALVLLGVLAITMPAHHVFYGVLSLAVGLYALVGVNLGGFLFGTILASIGGVLVVAWMTPAAKAAARERASSTPRARRETSTGESV